LQHTDEKSVKGKATGLDILSAQAVHKLPTQLTVFSIFPQALTPFVQDHPSALTGSSTRKIFRANKRCFGDVEAMMMLVSSRISLRYSMSG